MVTHPEADWGLPEAQRGANAPFFRKKEEHIETQQDHRMTRISLELEEEGSRAAAAAPGVDGAHACPYPSIGHHLPSASIAPGEVGAQGFRGQGHRGIGSAQMSEATPKCHRTPSLILVHILPSANISNTSVQAGLLN